MDVIRCGLMLRICPLPFLTWMNGTSSLMAPMTRSCKSSNDPSTTKAEPSLSLILTGT
jgi:hypothetical protein